MKIKTYIGSESTTKHLRAVSRKVCNMGRILVVDDQQAIRDVFKLLLSIEIPQCQIDLAENGEEAVKHFVKDHEGILLMDLHMPVMDGQKAFHEIEKICKEENFEMPSVLFCSGYHPSKELRNIITENTAHGLLLKPISCQTLVNEIRKRMAA